jgi:tripartite-type tricarboxylate transporter receptor subunit TctC
MLTTPDGSTEAPGSQGLATLGLADMAITIWWGLIAPKNVPSDRLERLTSVFSAAARQAEFATLMQQQAAVIQIDTGEAFARSIRAEYEALGEVARQLNLLR